MNGNFINRYYLVLSLLFGFIAFTGCSTPCPLRINAGAGDPECEDPVKPTELVLTKEDSATLIKMLSIMKLPSTNLKDYAYADSSRRIVTLGFSLSGIDTLPEEIGNLTKVSNLVLDDNKIRSIPKSIGALTELTGLRIDNNDLMDIPVEMLSLNKVTFFAYSGNPFCNVDQQKINWMVQKSGTPFVKGSECP